ncbi:hypothetical protein ESCOCK354M_20300 [Escherichia coli]
MAVPKHLRFFTLFVDGENEVGKVTSVTPPKLTRKTDSYRGGGMMGAVSIDLGLDDSALDASFVTGIPSGHFLPGCSAGLWKG